MRRAVPGEGRLQALEAAPLQCDITHLCHIQAHMISSSSSPSAVLPAESAVPDLQVLRNDA